ncbi:MAG: hypothetical protein VXW22_15005, partial [Pseudomonadota bacterium]|nr:hypothetical protein [Pseudomonadota bacterium]
MSRESRAAKINAKTPDLVAEVTLYPSSESGRSSVLKPGYGCPCFVQKNTEQPGWDAWMQLGKSEFTPGETRTVGFCFLSGEKAAKEMRKALGAFAFLGLAELTEGERITP